MDAPVAAVQDHLECVIYPRVIVRIVIPFDDEAAISGVMVIIDASPARRDKIRPVPSKPRCWAN